VNAAVQVLTGSLAFALYAATAEYLSHRLVMHIRTPLSPSAFREHAVLHHGDAQDEQHINLSLWFNGLVCVPLLVIELAAGWYLAAAIVPLGVAAYTATWNLIHRRFHGVGSAWPRRLPGFAALERHHLGHHAHQSKNFGGLFGPLLDRPLGTQAKP
jgi:Fatty acid hydroxylase superfamily